MTARCQRWSSRDTSSKSNEQLRPPPGYSRRVTHTPKPADSSSEKPISISFWVGFLESRLINATLPPFPGRTFLPLRDG
eukprot:1186887-Prymnesium_polylepis.1